MEQRPDHHAQQHAGEGREEHEPYERDRGRPEHPTDPDAASVRHGQCDQEDEEHSSGGGIEVEASPMGPAGEPVAGRLGRG